jgi:hypothetical protein
LVIVGQTVGYDIGIAGNFVRQEVAIQKMIEASQRMVGKENNNNNNPAMHKYFELRIKLIAGFGSYSITILYRNS